MTELTRQCQCRNIGETARCTADMTAEDLLCDYCRSSKGSCAGFLDGGPHFKIGVDFRVWLRTW